MLITLKVRTGNESVVGVNAAHLLNYQDIMRLITKIHSLPATKTCGKEMTSIARLQFLLWGGVIDSSCPPNLPPHVSPFSLQSFWLLGCLYVCLPMIYSTSLALTSLGSIYFFAVIPKIALDLSGWQPVTTRWGQQFWCLLYHSHFKMCLDTSYVDCSSFFPPGIWQANRKSSTNTKRRLKLLQDSCQSCCLALKKKFAILKWRSWITLFHFKPTLPTLNSLPLHFKREVLLRQNLPVHILGEAISSDSLTNFKRH